MQRLRLLWLKTGKSAAPKPTAPRVRSPSGGSTLITSAPIPARISEHDGPMTVWPSSSTRMPSSGNGFVALLVDSVLIGLSFDGNVGALQRAAPFRNFAPDERCSFLGARR